VSGVGSQLKVGIVEASEWSNEAKYFHARNFRPCARRTFEAMTGRTTNVKEIGSTRAPIVLAANLDRAQNDDEAVGFEEVLLWQWS
jgi:hypothetical protein